MTVRRNKHKRGRVNLLYKVLDFFAENFPIPKWLPLVISLVALAAALLNVRGS
ncbi:hypothetical protein SCACP_30290 [Sporomusa carbonis]